MIKFGGLLLLFFLGLDCNGLNWRLVVDLLQKMTPVCPFVKAARPDEASSKKCPFGFDSQTNSGTTTTTSNNNNINSINKQQQQQQQQQSASASPVVEAKCPFGYDSQTFKLGPLSCIICQALIFQCSRCVPCSHAFCK